MSSSSGSHKTFSKTPIAGVEKQPTPTILAVPRHLDFSLPPMERIKARHELNREHIAELRTQIGDPVEALSKILADIPLEVFAEDYEEGEDGTIYIKWY